jgi:hypothetical protein
MTKSEKFSGALEQNRISIATAQRPFGEEMSIYRGTRKAQS